MEVARLKPRPSGRGGCQRIQYRLNGLVAEEYELVSVERSVSNGSCVVTVVPVIRSATSSELVPIKELRCASDTLLNGMEVWVSTIRIAESVALLGYFGAGISRTTC